MAEAAAAFVVKMFALQGAAASVVSAAATVAVNAALYAGISAIARQNSEEKQQGGLIDLQLNSAAPRQLVIGKRMTGGVLVDWYLAGNNNTKLYLPVYLSEGPCGQITKVYADGRLVWSTPLVHGTRTTIPDFRSGGDRLWLTYYDGRVGQTADATLVGLSQGWTSANKMTGCAWVLIECQWDSDNMRSPPSLSFEMEGAKLYDRRKDTTAGGSGSHRLDDPATWEFSDNPAVALDHFLLGRYWSGARTFGIGLSADEVPYSYFAAQANICDENVTLKAGGTQKRYRANGFIFANEDYATVITRLCTAMAARPADFGGRFGVVGSESRTPVLTIDDGDLIAGVQEVYTPKRSWGELVGAVEGRFQDPAQLYQPTPYPTVTDAAWETEDGGEPKLMTLDLEMETDVERAQRLATLKARAERRQATLRGVYPLWTVELERGDWFVRTGAKWGVDGKTFEVLERVLDPASYTVTIVSQEVDPADSAWDETTASDGPPAPLSPTDTLSAVQVPSLTVTPITIAGLAATIPSLKVAWAAVTDPRVIAIFIEVFRDGDDQKVATAFQAIPDDDNQVIVQNGIADDVAYYVRARFLTATLPSAWSSEVAATSDDAYALGSASTVPWSGVTDDNGMRPDNNADVTAANTAAAIAGQGTGATANSLAGLNATDNANLTASLAAIKRLIVDDFSGSGRHWTTDFGGSPDTVADPVADGYFDVANIGRVIRITPTRYLQPKGIVKPLQGRRYLVVARLRVQTDPSSGSITASISNVNGLSETFVHGNPTFTQATPVNAINSKSNFVVADGWITLARIFTAGVPSTYDAFVRWRLDLTQSGSGGKVEVAAFSAFDVTDIPVGRALTELFRADGSTALTDAAVVTSLGTAAAITSQGALATRSTVLPSQTTEFDTSNMVVDSELLDSSYWTTGAGWTFASTDSPEVVTTLAANRAIKSVVGNGTTSQAATATDTGTSQYIGVEADGSYRLSGKVLNKSGFTGRARLGVVWYDAAKALISISYVFGNNYTTTPAGSDVVQTISGVVKAPANAVYARFRTLVEWSTTQNNAQRAYFANLRMMRAPQLGNHMVREDGATLLTDANAVTALGTAAAIASQGAFATLNSAAYGSALLTGFGALAAKATIDNSGLVGSGVIVFTALSSTAVRLGTNITRNDGTTSLTDALAVTSLGTAAAIASQGALATLSQVNLGGSGRVYRDDGTTRLTDALAVTSLGTAAAIASQGALATLGQVNLGASGRVYRDDGSTRLTDALAVTSLGTAAAIASQGALATLGQVNLGASGRVYRDDGTTRLTDALAVTALGTAAAIAGQGGLATLSFVQLNSNVRLQDGTTIITDALVVTASGTAAAIAGQGNFATVNFVRQATDPGGSEGKWWVDTTNSLLKLYTGGAWQVIADITTSANVAAAVAENVFTKSAGVGGFTTSGTTIATIATIDVNNVPASGFLKLLNAYLPVGSYTLSSGTTWDGQLIVTEQLQSGGTEHTLYTISVQLDTGLLGFTYEGGNDPGAIYPKTPVAQNVSGNSRYRLKLQRTSGTNNINASPASGGFFQIERTPG